MMEDATGKIAGKYQLLHPLGEGGTANVFLSAVSGPAGFNKLVVLKALKPSLADELELRDMFLSEARLSARLRHRNIVEVLEVVDHSGVPVIVMPYLDGQQLSSLLARGVDRMGLGMRLRIVAEALRGLHYSHELHDYDGTPLGVVHRDVTPQNVFVTYDGQVKLLDFGIAKLGAAPGQTQTGVLKGKIRYMSPEQILGEGIDRRVDLFACGVMLWEMVAGRSMWPDDASEASILESIVNEELPALREVVPDVPDELEGFVNKALACVPEERYQTAAELCEDLERFMDTLPDTDGPKQAGQLARELFEDERAQVKAVIEERLKNEKSFSMTLTAGGTLDGFYRDGSQQPPLPSTPAEGRGLGPRELTLLVLTGVLAAAALFFILQPGSRPDVGRQSAAPAAPPPSAGPELVELRVTAFPLHARIEFDGEPTDSNRLIRKVSEGGAQHTLKVSAEGYETVQRSFNVRGAMDLVVTLEKAAPPAPSGSASAAQKDEQGEAEVVKPRPRRRWRRPVKAPAPAAEPESQPSKAGNCDPPYYLSGGVKKYKLECL